MMSDKRRAALIHYGVLTALVLVAAIGIAWYEISQYGSNSVNWMRFLCDGFFVVGIILLCFGGMLWISQAGGFHALSYLFYTVSYMFTASKSRFNKRKNFYEYKVEKMAKEEDKDKSLQRHILVAGAVSFAISIVFLILFYQV